MAVWLTSPGSGSGWGGWLKMQPFYPDVSSVSLCCQVSHCSYELWNTTGKESALASNKHLACVHTLIKSHTYGCNYPTFCKIPVNIMWRHVRTHSNVHVHNYMSDNLWISYSYFLNNLGNLGTIFIVLAISNNTLNWLLSPSWYHLLASIRFSNLTQHILSVDCGFCQQT